jgi:uncharacterized delta-60 repeat protein
MKSHAIATGFPAVLALCISQVLLGGCASYLGAARALVVQPDGSPVAAGVACIGKGCDFALARYLPDGGLDTSFGKGGKVVTHFAGSLPAAASRFWAGSYARALVVQPDGKLIAAGVVRLGSWWPWSITDAWAIARYLPDGRLDSSFGSEGVVTTAMTGEYMIDYAVPALAQQPDGKFIFAAHEPTGRMLGKVDQFGFVVIRYLADGTIDRTFGQNGSAITSFAGGWFASARAVCVQPDGKLVAAGFTVLNELDHFALVRYLPDGSLDRSFGEAGVATLALSHGKKGQIGQGFLNRGPFALVLQPDGRLIAAGATEGLKGRTVFGLARFLPDGTPDRSFGVDGIAATDFGDGGVAFAAALQQDGKVVVAGTTGIADLPFTRGEPPCEKFALARYLPNGGLDAGFGVGGKVVGDQCGRPQAIGIQPDGKLIAAGRTETRQGEVFALARYLPDGRLDSTFGTGGMVTTEFFSEQAVVAGIPR